MKVLSLSPKRHQIMLWHHNAQLYSLFWSLAFHSIYHSSSTKTKSKIKLLWCQRLFGVSSETVIKISYDLGSLQASACVLFKSLHLHIAQQSIILWFLQILTLIQTLYRVLQSCNRYVILGLSYFILYIIHNIWVHSIYVIVIGTIRSFILQILLYQDSVFQHIYLANCDVQSNTFV